MTINNEPLSPSLPYEDDLFSRLKDPLYAGLFMASTLEEDAETPGALALAVSDVIRANAMSDSTIAICSLMLTLEHLNTESILKLLALLLDSSPLHVRRDLTRNGFKDGIHKLANEIASGQKVFLEEIGITTDTPGARQMKEAFDPAA